MTDPTPLVRDTEFHSTSDEAARKRTRKAYLRRSGLWDHKGPSGRWIPNKITSRKRQRFCGRIAAQGNANLEVPAMPHVCHNKDEGYAFIRGLAHCGYPTCPTCGRKLAHGRAEEIREAIENTLARGGGSYMIMLTLPHGPKDRLSDLLDSTWRAWGKVNQGRAWVEDQELFGVFGTIRSLEATYGNNGWHPHLHVLIFTEEKLDRVSREALSARIYHRWGRKIAAQGHGEVRQELFKLIPVQTAEAIGRYLSKVTGDDHEGRTFEPRKAGLEMARGDLKVGKKNGLSPLQILDIALEMPDEPEGVAAAELWRSWEKSVTGRQLIRWSGRGDGFLKRILNVADLTDEDILEAKEAATVTVPLTVAQWQVLRNNPHRIRLLLDYVVSDGVAVVDDVVDWIAEGDPFLIPEPG